MGGSTITIVVIGMVMVHTPTGKFQPAHFFRSNILQNLHNGWHHHHDRRYRDGDGSYTNWKIPTGTLFSLEYSTEPLWKSGVYEHRKTVVGYGWLSYGRRQTAYLIYAVA
jgi:hypothetical protein